MRWPLIARRLHKWLALFVAVQVLLWTMTGLYMVSVPLGIIHGDHLVRAPTEQPYPLAELVDPAQLAARYPGLHALQLQRLIEKPVYVVETAAGVQLLDARTGAVLPPPSEQTIRALARHWYTGTEPIAEVTLLDKVPLEMQARTPPLWRVEFEGWNRPTLYFSPQTGELLARRHELWRIFDFAWMLHIMDYSDRSDVNNPLLRVATWTAAAMAISGAWLLVWSFSGRKRAKARP